MTPLHSVSLAGHPLRIYASPHPEPDYPWASFDDLAELSGWDDDVRQDRWEQMHREVPEMLHKTPDGERLIANPIVGGLFMGWLQMGYGLAQALLDEWHEAWSQVFAAQFAHLPRTDWLKVVQTAELRNVPMVPGATTLN